MNEFEILKAGEKYRAKEMYVEKDTDFFFNEMKDHV